VAKFKIQIKVEDEVRRKLKILAELEKKTFQDFLEGVLDDMVSEVEITLTTKQQTTEDK
jgi:mRNA-degrading endonuclease RelE of RelBE toxin-antitoxin system